MAPPGPPLEPLLASTGPNLMLLSPHVFVVHNDMLLSLLFSLHVTDIESRGSPPVCLNVHLTSSIPSMLSTIVCSNRGTIQE